jgi:hypothetical protein
MLALTVAGNLLILLETFITFRLWFVGLELVCTLEHLIICSLGYEAQQMRCTDHNAGRRRCGVGCVCVCTPSSTPASPHY